MNIFENDIMLVLSGIAIATSLCIAISAIKFALVKEVSIVYTIESVLAFLVVTECAILIQPLRYTMDVSVKTVIVSLLMIISVFGFDYYSIFDYLSNDISELNCSAASVRWNIFSKICVDFLILMKLIYPILVKLYNAKYWVVYSGSTNFSIMICIILASIFDITFWYYSYIKKSNDLIIGEIKLCSIVSVLTDMAFIGIIGSNGNYIVLKLLICIALVFTVFYENLHLMWYSIRRSALWTCIYAIRFILSILMLLYAGFPVVVAVIDLLK